MSMHPSDDDFMLNVIDSLKHKRWAEACIGMVLWVVIIVGSLLLAPFACAYWIWELGKKLVLKFRWWASDILQPHTPAPGRDNKFPDSDLVQEFVDYEAAVDRGTATTQSRSDFISHLAHLEQELHEYRTLGAAINRLRRHSERPRRREAIMDQRERKLREDE